jgi:hypothetical protein
VINQVFVPFEWVRKFRSKSKSLNTKLNSINTNNLDIDIHIVHLNIVGINTQPIDA